MPHDHAHTVEHAGQAKHRERKPKVTGQPEDDRGESEPGHAPEQRFARMLHRRQVGNHQRHDEGADSRRRAHPTESDRAAMQDLIGEDREERRRPTEQYGNHVERDRRQNHLLAQHELNSFFQAPPGVPFRAAPAIAASNRQDQEEEPDRSDRIDQINHGEPGSNDE